MQVPTYTFQSPYGSAIQVGRPEPQAFSQDDAKEAVDTLSQAGNTSLQDAKSYTLQNTSSSLNVAQSSTDPVVSASLETFNTLKAQVQGNKAYSD